MQRCSLLCSSISVSSPFNPHLFFPSFKFELSRSRVQLPFHLLHRRTSIFHAQSTAVQELPVTSNSELELVEIGFLSGVHGLQGEICVKPSTDFPELRFSKPGIRWLRQQVNSRKAIQQVELVEGRPHPGQKSWILKFRGIDTVDQVKQLVGSTLLAKEDDRPELEEGEFYTRDLVGMRVLLKETGQCVGTVVNVFNSGASDLLHVLLDSSLDMPNGTAKSNSLEPGQSDHLVWIPFVEAIVPDVDLHAREMQITPPNGLLELNLRSDDRSKKERRQLEWKERKKFQKRLIAAKKKLCELQQQHVFHGFRYGEKSQRNLLAEQIVGVNSKLLQIAWRNIETSPKRWDPAEQLNDARAKLPRSTLKISREYLTPGETGDKQLGENSGLSKRGSSLFSKGKGSLCLVLNDFEGQNKECESDLSDLENTGNSSYSYLQALLSDDQRIVKAEDRANVPIFLVCPTHGIEDLQKFFLDNDYFGFDSEKVWFLEEERLPVVCNSLEEHKKLKILMKSPWEILQLPVGSGGVISLLSSHGILDTLVSSGVDYFQVCSVNAAVDSLLLGFVDSKGAELGVQIPENALDLEESFNMVFSMNAVRKLTKQIDKLQFYAVPKANSHVEKVEKEWLDIIPSSSPNSLEIRASIYSCLNVCSDDKICFLEVTD